MAFYVGQKVVCVDDDVNEADGVKRIHAGAVYVVAKLYPNGHPLGSTRHYGKDAPCIDLVGVSRTSPVPYAAARFRPLVERKTDISALKALLNTAPEKVLT